MKHVIVIPYYCPEEIERYLRIAGFMSGYTRSNVACEVLLASVLPAGPDAELFGAFSKFAPTREMQCHTQEMRYPQRASEMFWEVMRYIGAEYERDDGFFLWLESDMLPCKPDWLDRLHAEWLSAKDAPVMGLFLPLMYLFGKARGAHINGGACYAKNLSDLLPARCTDTFDLLISRVLEPAGRLKASRQFAFATEFDYPQLIADPEKTLLHGYMQNKDRFIRSCIDYLQAPALLRKWIGMQKRIPTYNLNKCCKYRYWIGFKTFCPLHSRPSEGTMDREPKEVRSCAG
ncbi:MAG: hypothetical protein PHN49_01310 [Candidatus Omnitrophica bacterium]|nr:hypothetical protein [Candidatus Omnitrophota bacterium]MDD5670255.1 hypothetical protein [Candidatus Omnitrophota bacterium]